MTAIPPEAAWYLPTDVKVRSDGRWILGFEFCKQNQCEIHVITAWNPGDERPSRETNESRNVELLTDISSMGFEAIEALGSDPSSDHEEKSWAVIGLDNDAAIELGKKYGQVAIFKISCDQQTVLGCLDKWEISRSPG